MRSALHIEIAATTGTATIAFPTVDLATQALSKVHGVVLESQPLLVVRLHECGHSWDIAIPDKVHLTKNRRATQRNAKVRTVTLLELTDQDRPRSPSRNLMHFVLILQVLLLRCS